MFSPCQQTSCAFARLQNQCFHELMLQFARSENSRPSPSLSVSLSLCEANYVFILPAVPSSKIHRSHSTNSLSRGHVFISVALCLDRLCLQTFQAKKGGGLHLFLALRRQHRLFSFHCGR